MMTSFDSGQPGWETQGGGAGAAAIDAGPFPARPPRSLAPSRWKRRAPVLLLLLSAAAFAALAVTGSLESSAICVPILVLMVWRANRCASVIAEVSEIVELDEAAVFRLQHDVGLREQLIVNWESDARSMRNRAVQRSLERGLVAGDSPDANTRGTDNVVRSSQGTLALTLAQLRDRFRAREDLSLAEIETVLLEHDQRRLAPLSNASDLFFGLGFVGSLAGIILQARIAASVGDGVLSRNFLAGTLLAVTTTLQGVLSAFYVRFNLARLTTDLDDVRERALEIARQHLLPIVNDVQPEEAAAATAARLVERMFENLLAKLNASIGLIPEQLAGAVAKATDQSVGLLSNAIVKPTQKTLENYKSMVDQSAGALTQAASRIEGASAKVIRASQLPDEVVEGLRAAESQVRSGGDGLNKVATECNKVAEAINSAAAMLKTATRQVAGSPARGAAGTLVEDLSSAVENAFQLTRNLQEVLRSQTELLGAAMAALGTSRPVELPPPFPPARASRDR